ncbi:hypothetical protein [Leadbetterella sp. DM7]|uniref:hypothetical protein n=1 Tax=Leadbetterella sp. DM7 TaxID=3235085 RepID=UPI00349F04E0
MVREIRERYNASFSNEKYQRMLDEIHTEFPGMLDFRIAESPVFVGRDLKMKVLTAFNDIVDQIRKPEFAPLTRRAIPENLWVDHENPVPGCLAVDFAITQGENGEYEPQLIELQGFPSLYAYQAYLAGKFRKFFDVDRGYSEFFNRLNTMSYTQEMKSFLLGNSAPENTVLLEIYPEKQKTRLDFAITRKLWGIEPVCVTRIRNSGTELYYEKDGKKIAIERIYNRLIMDDLERNYPDLKLEADFNKAADVQWVSHPNWFYRVSKFSLPLFKSKYIPESRYLSDFKELPDDLENYVLKPLFSFAGAGVIIDVTREDIAKIQDPENYLLQRKIAYSPCIEDINGDKIKCEVRLLAIWPDGADRPKLMTNLARLSRGKMIGVDFNKDFDWVGGSIGFYETN